ncbi:hypothetical protein Tco_1420069 [Tanacetum coccineum]
MGNGRGEPPHNKKTLIHFYTLTTISHGGDSTKLFNGRLMLDTVPRIYWSMGNVHDDLGTTICGNVPLQVVLQTDTEFRTGMNTELIKFVELNLFPVITRPVSVILFGKSLPPKGVSEKDEDARRREMEFVFLIRNHALPYLSASALSDETATGDKMHSRGIFIQKVYESLPHAAESMEFDHSIYSSMYFAGQGVRQLLPNNLLIHCLALKKIKHRAFWGADDEEVSEGGIPQVIILGYDRLPIQPVAPPSPDYIPGPEDPQTPPVPQDEDEREPMFIQAHDPDYVPKPIYPEYIPLEDDHEFQAKEQPLPPIDSPTAESPGYVTESDPEEDPEEYEDDETEDGPVDYPMDGGDDGDDDDGDSSRDDANDEDEDDEDEEEEEEEHLAPADSTIVVPVDEPVFPPEGTEPVIPPPSTDITIGARITVRPQTSISLPPEAEVERLLTMTTPSPSPPISLSPPSAGERLARIASTQALIDAVTAALPSPPLPPLPPSLYIPPPVDHRDEIPESEQPPRKRPTEDRDRYDFGQHVDAKRGDRIRDVGYELAELHGHDTQDLYALLEDAQDSRSRISQRVDMDSQRVDLLMRDRMTLQETIWMVEEEAYASREA